MVRDIVAVIILDGVLAFLTLAYVWAIKHIWTGMASIHVAVWYAILALICTVVGGMQINRLWVEIAGVIILWVGLVAVDAAASEASFGDVAISALIPILVQLVVFIAAWWIATKISTHELL